MNQRGRTLFIVLSTVIVITAVVFSARPAKADPHAMFYTAIGQQQLFFNALAALDQADYVEPATGSSPYSREKLLQNYTTAKQSGSSDTQLNKTKTDLSSIVTRGVTLQGNDLWESYKQFQLSLEASRRNATAELAAKFCQHSLGILGCDSSKIQNNQKNKAYVVDPVTEPAQAIIQRGIEAAFASGSTDGLYGNDQQERKDIKKNKEKAPLQYYAYDGSIALLRQQTNNDPQKSAIVDQLLSGIQYSLSAPPRIDASLFNEINIDSDGNAQLAYQPTGRQIGGTAYAAGEQLSGEAFAQKYLNSVDTALSWPLSALMVGEQAMNKAATSLSADQSGFKADRVYNPQILPGDQIGEIKANVQAPAYSKIADLQSMKNLIGAVEANQAFAPSNAAENPGQVQMLVPANGGDVSGTISYASDYSPTQAAQQMAQLQATQKKISAGTATQGEVKGAMDVINNLVQYYISLYATYDQPRQAVSTDTNPTAAANENGFKDALTAADPNFDPESAKTDAASAGNQEFLDSIMQSLCGMVPFCQI